MKLFISLGNLIGACNSTVNTFKRNICILTYCLCLVSFSGFAQTPIGTLTTSDSRDQSGFSVSLSADGTILAVGSPQGGNRRGIVRVYQYSNGNWEPFGGTSTSPTTIPGVADNGKFGSSVSLSADGIILAVAAPTTSLGGNVRVFKYNSSNEMWEDRGTDINHHRSGTDIQFGEAVSLSDDGTRLAIGAHQDDASGGGNGLVEVYEWNSSRSDWDLKGTLLGAANQHLGFSVSLSGDGTRLAVGGSIFYDERGIPGSVQVYEWSGSNWTPLANSNFPGSANELLGYSVSLNSNGSRLAIGAPKADAGGTTDGGSVDVYEWNGTTSKWDTLGSAINGKVDNESLGFDVSLDASGNTLAIGAPALTGSTTANKVRLYRYNGSNWIPQGEDIDPVTSSDLGYRPVSLSSDGAILATGNPGSPLKNDDYVKIFADFNVLFAGGSGTQADPYKIATADQLNNVGRFQIAHFQQTADIDLGVAPYDTTNNAPGWTPIAQFNGTFNGNGYTISNLRIKPPIPTNPNTIVNLGLFAGVGEKDRTATLENMTLINPFVTNGNNVGAFAGVLGSAHLRNVHVVGGSVTSVSSVDSANVGGLAGLGALSIRGDADFLSITKSSAVGMTITSTSSLSNTRAGGLAGRLHTNSTISDSYAANKVRGGKEAGGLVAQYWGTITNSYSSSVIDRPSSEKVGGLVASRPQPVPGQSPAVVITGSYFNHDSTTTKNVTPDNVLQIGDSLNTTQMKQRASFSGWDFTNTWFIDEGVSFPRLQESRGNYIDITGNEGWRMLASPLQSQSIGSLLAPLWTQGFPGADVTNGTPNVYFYNESTPISQPWSAPTDTSFTPAAGTGFLMYVYSDDNLDGIPEGFPKRLTPTGTPVSGQVSVNLSYSNTNPEDPNLVGFNLVGNPYPTTINWDASRGWTRKGTNVNEAFYVWNNAASSYQAWNGITGTKGDGLIAPWQAFWVEVRATAGANPQIVFTDTVRNAGGVLLKQAKPVIPKIDLELEGGELSSKSVVMFHEKAERGKDPYDAYKLQSLNPDYLLLGTSIDGLEAMDIQVLPYSEEPMELDLVIEGSDLNGEFSLNWANSDIPEGWEISLLDTKTGEMHQMDADGSISFSMNIKTKASVQRDSGTIPKAPIQVVKAKTASSSRFVLRIQGSMPVSNELDSSLPTKLALHQNYPNPFNPGTTINYDLNVQDHVRLEVFDLLGRKVATLVNNEPQQAGRYSVRFDATALASGVYLYRLETGSKVLLKKMTVIK